MLIYVLTTIEVTNYSRQAMVLYLEIRQQVCLLYCFRGNDFARFFKKNLAKSLPLKNNIEAITITGFVKE